MSKTRKRSKKNGGGSGGAEGKPPAQLKQNKKASGNSKSKDGAVVVKSVPAKQQKQQQQQQAKAKGYAAGKDKGNDKGVEKLTGLSKMQAEMRRRLDGGKFRMLNEQLYTTTGKEAFKTFQDEPELFDVYHQGFREQAEKWPVNPLDTFIDYVKRHPKAVVADFGCGDARLSESVKNKVHSFDLVSRKPQVTACNIAKVPLANNTIDIAVYCLALMGTSVREFILEVHRVLKPKGVLKVAEVKSRFETEQLGGIAGFVDVMKQLGFDLARKDEENKMFALFEFVKSNRTPDKNAQIELKPCEYKRR